MEEREIKKDNNAKEETTILQHGQWLYGTNPNNIYTHEIYCPLCGKEALYPSEDSDDDPYRPFESPFCPHCGTKMDAPCPDPTWPYYKMSLKEKQRKEQPQ